MPFLGLPLTVNPPEPPDPGSESGGGGAGEGVGPSSSALTITAADGTVFDLTDRSRYLGTLGRKGFDATQYTVYADEAPMVSGEIFRSARAQPRDLFLPVFIRGDSREQFLIRKRDFFSRLSPAHGLAEVTVAEPDGTRRRIACYFTGAGGEGDGARDQSSRTWARYILQLRCPDPYWRGDPIHASFAAPSSARFLATPWLPYRVQSSQSFGSTSFDNPGDQMSYPVWTINGPCSGGIVLTRNTPDLPVETLTLQTTLTNTQTLTIDCHPELLTILRDNGSNHWPDLDAGSRFWQVSPGTNLINVAVGGAGPTTLVTLDVEPRFETV